MGRLRLVHPLGFPLRRMHRFRTIVYPSVQILAYCFNFCLLTSLVLRTQRVMINVDTEDCTLNFRLQLSKFDIVNERQNITSVCAMLHMGVC
jgi:hypothetical protein